MPTSVQLQSNMISCLPVIVLLALILLLPIAYWLVKRILLSFKSRPKQPEIILPPPVPRKMPQEIKAEYLNRLYGIQRSYELQEITSKQTYLMLSMLVREFVKKYTGIEATTKTLSELAQMNMPQLYELVIQLYEPEFSLLAEADVRKLILQTKRVIEIWN